MNFRRLYSALIMSLVSCGAIASNQFQEFDPNLHEKIDGKYAMKNELLVAVRPGSDTSHFARQFTGLKGKGFTILNNEMISSEKAKVKIIKIKLNSRQSLMSLQSSIQHHPDVEWVQPNYIYNIGFDPREELPNDVRLEDQYHHKLMANIKAWDITTGANVLVAVTDDGFDTSHEDLASRFIAKKGYNFCDNNDDVTANYSGGNHGTHVSGIVAAELNNGKGGAGVAGNATILPIKFYGGSCRWTSELIYRAYQYSADSGAKIISTSYNIDGFVNDKTFVAAIDYAYDKGILHFNSAGNNGQRNPARDAFNKLILVASTNSQDVKSSFSNYGKRIQISAPGESILSTTPANKYAYMSGTSMATPNAAGAAALIWAAHPSWDRDQVAAQLIGTADNIDDKNPKYKDMLGSGRVNSERALTEKLAPAKVKDVVVTSSPMGPKKKTVNLAIHFDKLLSPNVVNQGQHWEIKSANGQTFSASMKNSWEIGSMILELVLQDLDVGKYQLTVKDSLKDPFGQAIDGKGTGAAGGNFVYTFEVK